jgi:hypothetical protein
MLSHVLCLRWEISTARGKIIILLQVDPLLGNDLKTNDETTSTAKEQILKKQVYAAVAG